MTKQIFVMAHNQARQRALQAVQHAPAGHRVTVEEPKRTLPQNDLMWGLLTDISKQVKHCDQWLDAQDWKDMLTAHWKGQRMVMNLAKNGLVALGASTSKMTKSEMTEFIELIRAWGKTEAPVEVRFFDEQIRRVYCPRIDERVEA